MASIWLNARIQASEGRLDRWTQNQAILFLRFFAARPFVAIFLRNHLFVTIPPASSLYAVTE